MKNIQRKIGGFILSVCLVLLLNANVAQAASASLSLSGGSGKVGSTVSVKCTVSCSTEIGTANVTLKYDPSELEYVSGSGGYSVTGGSGSVSCNAVTSSGTEKSFTFTIKFKILKEGSLKVSSTSASGYNLDEEPLSISGASTTISAKAETTSNSGSSNSGSSNSGSSNSGSSNSSSSNSGSSTTTTPTPEEPREDSNSKLTSLNVYPGALSPAFDKNTTSYTVEVTDEVKEVTITATAASDKAKVVVSGGKELQLGDNAAKVVVTAEDGTTTVYNLNIVQVKIEKINHNGVEHIIDEAFTDDSIPTGFTETSVKYNENSYRALVNEAGTMKLMSLKAGDVTKFYIYNEADQTFIDFIPVEITAGKFIYIKALDETNEEFGAYEVTKLLVNEQEVDAWKLDDVFSMVCAWDMQGKEVLYRHDNVDGIYQRYAEIVEKPAEPEEPEKVLNPIESFLADYYLYVIIGLGALVLILLIIVICLAATRKTKRGKGKARERRKARKEALKKEVEQEVERIE